MKYIGYLTIALALSLSQAYSRPYIVVDGENGAILAHNDAFERWYPASLTKMMTLYIALEAIEQRKISLNSPVVISAVAAKQTPSRSGYNQGTVLSLSQALEILMVKSANDVAVAISEALAGSEANFVALMNNRAKLMGLVGSHFANSNGLPNQRNYSTARDMAVLSFRLIRDFPQYRRYFSIPALSLHEGQKPMLNSNQLIGRFKGADGLKTGFICASGFNLAASATRHQRTIIAVVLGAASIRARERLAAQLLEQGFKTAGDSALTLSTLQPYGENLTEPTNLYQSICNIKAVRARKLERDDEGNIMFNSPLISADPTPFIVRKIVPLYVAPKVISAPTASGQGKKVPVPIRRPSN